MKRIAQVVVLVIDDLHWADRPTLQLFRFLADQTPDLPLVLISGLRESELDPSSPLYDLISRLRRLDHTHHVRLSGLADPDIAEFVAAVAHTHGDAGHTVARRLAGETGGNPLFATKLLRHLVETDHAGRVGEQHRRAPC